MNRNIIIELCAEDRARLDKLTEALTRSAEAQVAPTIAQNEANPVPVQTEPEQLEIPEMKQETATEPTENTPPWEEAPAAAPVVTDPVVAEPTVSLEQIRQKVVLLASRGKDTKEKVKAVVSAYAENVSLLPREKWDEVWARLVKLEG